MRTRHEPRRTCVGCRETAAKSELVRVVRTPGGEVRIDPSGKVRLSRKALLQEAA